MVLSHTETNIVFFHYLLDVFNEHAALDGCLINNEYAHKYKIKSGRDCTDDLLQLLCSLQVKKEDFLCSPPNAVPPSVFQSQDSSSYVSNLQVKFNTDFIKTGREAGFVWCQRNNL